MIIKPTLFLVFCFSIGAAVLLQCSDGAKSDAGQTASPTAKKALAHYRVGDGFRSNIDMTLALTFKGRSTPQQVGIRGSLHRMVTDVLEREAVVSYRLSETTVTLKENVGSDSTPAQPSDTMVGAQEKAMAERLSSRFFASYYANGALARLHFPNTMAPAIQNLLLAMVTELQVVRQGNLQEPWTFVEQDGNGEYLAAYQPLKEAGWFSKRKIKYLHAASGPNAPISASGTSDRATQVDIVRSERTYKLDEAGRLREIRGEESLNASLAGGLIKLTTSSTLILDETKTEQDASQVSAFAKESARLVTMPVKQVSLDTNAEMARQDRTLLGGATLEDLLKALDALGNEASPEERQPIIQRLRALFRLNEPACKTAVTAAKENRQVAAIVGALTLAGTPAAQKALFSLVEDETLPLDVRQSAIRSISHQFEPEESVLAGLAGMMDDADPVIRQMVRFSYGAQARALLQSKPEIAESIARTLVGRLSKASDDDRPDFVTALGNTGHPAALPALKTVIEESDDVIRARAIQAVGGIEGHETDALLLTLAKHDNEAVRASAASAMAKRPAGPFLELLVDMAENDPVRDVRNTAIDVVGRRSTQFPKLLQVLKEVSEKDPEKKNREQALRYLKRNTSAPGE